MFLTITNIYAMRRTESKAEERFKDLFILFLILVAEWIYMMLF